MDGMLPAFPLECLRGSRAADVQGEMTSMKNAARMLMIRRFGEAGTELRRCPGNSAKKDSKVLRKTLLSWGQAQVSRPGAANESPL